MTSKKLRILIFSILLLISNPVKISQERIPKVTTQNSHIVEKAIVNEPEQNKPLTVEFKTNKTVRIINILISYYTNSFNNCQSIEGISADGTNIVQASENNPSVTYVAAPCDVPFKTEIHIEGIGTAEVVDRGGAIVYVTGADGKEYMKLDVFVPNASQEELMDKGVVKTKGYIINHGN